MFKTVKQTILWCFVLAALYFVLRLTNIMSLPLFTDEAIYVRWAQIAKQDAAWRFISLTDGKQPSFIWIAMNIMRVVSDPLLAARLVSVFSGFGALIGIMLLSLELFKKKRTGSTLNRIFGQLLEDKTIGFITGLLFVLFPFALVMDRMAMYDSLVVCTMVWALYAEVLLIRYVRLDIALFTGLVMGSAVLTKTSGFFSIYLLPFSLLLFDFRQKDWRCKFVEWLVFVGIAVGLAYGIYSILRLSPFFYIINEKNALFVYPLSEWLMHPFEFLYGNFHALIEWFLIYTTIPVVIFAVLSFFIGKNFREKIFLLIWFLAPFVALGLFGKTLYPRFIYFMTIPVILLAAFAVTQLIQKFKSKILTIIIVLLAVSFSIYTDYFILFDFSHAPIPKADLGQYINSWPAGGGTAEMVKFFNAQSQKGKIYVATQGTFGSLPTNTMEIYLGENKNIETRGIYPLPSQLPADLKEKAKVMSVYYVFNDDENAPADWPLTLVGKYQKGSGDRHLSIYQINP